MTNLDTTLAKRGFSFAGLFKEAQLNKLDQDFIHQLPQAMSNTLLAWRNGQSFDTSIAESEWLIELSTQLDLYLCQLFDLDCTHSDTELALLMAFKARYVQRGAKRYRQPITLSFAELDGWLNQQLAVAIPNAHSSQPVAVCTFAMQQEPGSDTENSLLQWAKLAMDTPEGRAHIAKWVAFVLPERVDHEQLVPTQCTKVADCTVKMGFAEHFRARDGFNLTDPRMQPDQVGSEIDYCKYCHDHDGDFCRTGFPVKKGDASQGLKIDPLDNVLTGCPLEEKISEMQWVKKNGHHLAALALIMVDNPLLPATGHRICNDCMKACIYQKQTPVNIPQIETAVLTDVLNLPWGVEIYDLLTRWNPLKQQGFLPAVDNHKKVMVVGMGPAGFTLAHYLTHAGCHVVGVDGLKIEPLPPALLEQPIRDWQSLQEPLGERILAGFGGVAEYGITVRWDKNFLKLIHISLARRHNMQIFGGVRLGGTITLDSAFELGFDHIALAVGAGLPRILNIENSLARGMRQASDFLMAMQLTGAAKASSLANLQIRLPAVVIGGGLTAVDTATEVQAYYITQVEKVLHRVETLGEITVKQGLTEEDEQILDTFIEHARQIKSERQRAAQAGTAPCFIPLLHAWGGVTLAYRKGMRQSPAYTHNHEELIKALEEGIFYAEGLDPIKVELDQFGHVSGLHFNQLSELSDGWQKTGTQLSLPARCILVAAGTVPNTIYAQEYPNSLQLEGDHFLSYNDEGNATPVTQRVHAKSDFGAFTSYHHHNQRVSFIGDSHPVFNGSVVKAIASAQRSFPSILNALQKLPERINPQFAAQMRDLLIARVESVNTDNPAMTELWVRAPLAARHFKPGQFFRLQTYEQLSPIVAGTRLQIPLLTVSGTGVKDDCIRLMVLQWGTAPRLVSRLKKGDPLILMGPTGAATDLPQAKTILVIAGRWGAAVMLDIGIALREAGNKVIYLAAFEKASDVDHIDELEAGADQIIWCTQTGDQIPARRPQDLSLQATDMIALLKQLHQNQQLDTLHIDRLMAMGSTGLLKGLQKALSEGGELISYFKADLEVTGTVGSPMQCMMKGVCGQCLQWQIDPQTGQRTKAVFSCAGQDQPLKNIDLDNLAARTGQNRLLDRLSAQWLTHVLKQ